MKVVQTVATPKRSRTMTLDPKTHRLYVAAADYGAPATAPDGRPQRPPLVPGSFRIVVYEMAAPPPGRWKAVLFSRASKSRGSNS